MTQGQVVDSRQGEVRRMLEKMRNDLQSEINAKIREIRHHGTANEANRISETVESSSVDQDQDLDLDLTQAKDKKLAAIDRALERLTDGKYGYCHECENEIPLKRLEALPFAIRCRDCEKTHESELNQAHRRRNASFGQYSRFNN